MRNSLLLAVCLIALSYTSFAEETFVKESVKPPTYLQAKTVQAQMRANYPVLYSQYRIGVNFSRTGMILLGSGGTFCAAGLYMINKDEIPALWFGIILVDVGVSYVITSVPFFVIGEIKKSRAFKEFNRLYYPPKALPHFQLNVYPNRMGIAYVF